jgi:hypothetical protein
MKDLDAETYTKLALDGTRVNFEALLDPILIPRVPGTANHAAVRKVILTKSLSILDSGKLWIGNFLTLTQTIIHN